MADPTAETILAGAGAAGGRVSMVQKEAIRLLRACLPGTVALANSRENISIESPVMYYAVRESLEGVQLPCVAVGCAVGGEPLGTQANALDITMTVFVVGKRTEVREQVDDLWDLADLARLVLKTAYGVHCLPDPDGRKVWNACRFQSMNSVPVDWESCSAIAISYQVVQAGLTLWPQAVPEP